MNGLEASKLVISRLLADNDVKSKVSKKGNTYYIISGMVLPSEWKSKDKTINVYVTYESNRYEYSSIRVSAACRANTYAESRELAYAVVSCLDRVSLTGFSIVPNLVMTLEPVDGELSNYLTTVEILVRSA